jgi:hypothetical protein
MLSKSLVKLPLALAVVAVMAGCASGPTLHKRMPFPVEEYAGYAATGDSTVSGTATIERYNVEVTNPRNPVHEFMLLPITSYSLQALDIAWVPCFGLEPPDPRQEQYVRRIPPIANGSFVVDFEFKNVPAGKYFVVDRVTYDVSGASPTGKSFRARIAKVTVEPHKDNLNVDVRTPPDSRNGGESCTDFK